MNHITRTLTAIAIVAAGALAHPHTAHAASNVAASIDCTGVVTWQASHAEWGQQVTVTIDGTAHTHDRPKGWWDGDGPHGDWTATGSDHTDGDVTITWTDWEGGSQLHGPIRLTVPASCTTTIPAATTTVTATTSTPDTTVAPEPSTTAPAATTTTQTATTVPADSTTSSTPIATAPTSMPVQVTEPTVALGTAPRPPDTPQTTLRPTPPVAAVTTIQANTTTTNGAPNNHTCDDADPACDTATDQPVGELAVTGTGEWLIALIGYGLLILAIGAACQRLQTRPRTIR